MFMIQMSYYKKFYNLGVFMRQNKDFFKILFSSGKLFIILITYQMLPKPTTI